VTLSGIKKKYDVCSSDRDGMNLIITSLKATDKEQKATIAQLESKACCTNCQPYQTKIKALIIIHYIFNEIVASEYKAYL
jgi:hypothetical protein